MSSIKKLAGQTAIYGFSTILSRFMNYALLYLQTGIGAYQYGFVTQIYGLVPLANILLTYGMETTFFRFSQTENPRKVLSNSFLSLVITTILATSLILYFYRPLAVINDIGRHADYMIWVALIVACDTLTVIPFAQLRLSNRPIKYATLKFINILINVLGNIFFLSICPYLIHHGHPGILRFYRPDWGAQYIFISNFVASAVTLLLLLPEMVKIPWEFDFTFWKKMIFYAWPLIISGLAGMVNETLDRSVFLPHFLPFPEAKKHYLIGIYGANYKLSILITLFIQAFRMGAEPFFFQQYGKEDAPKLYARVLKYFVMIISVLFLMVAMYLNIWKYFAHGKEFWQGLYIVPVLLLANMFLGIYYNLTIWFKLTNNTRIGAIITIITAILAIILNIWWIPIWGYYGSALATMVCYFVQMTICYLLGQQFYPIPYPVKKLVSIMGLAIAVFLVYWEINLHFLFPQDPYGIHGSSLLLATSLLVGYTYFLYRLERAYLKNIFRTLIRGRRA
ncbi:MAG: oligosaccharide flippase family protein [Chitinophagaceae bacterium]